MKIFAGMVLGWLIAIILICLNEKWTNLKKRWSDRRYEITNLEVGMKTLRDRIKKIEDKSETGVTNIKITSLDSAEEFIKIAQERGILKDILK